MRGIRIIRICLQLHIAQVQFSSVQSTFCLNPNLNLLNLFFELGDELKLNLLILFRKSQIWNFWCLVSGHFWCAEF